MTTPKTIKLLPVPYMVSGMGEQESIKKYDRLFGKNNKRWWIPAAGQVPNRGDFVFAEGGPGSQGFGGREMQFPCADGLTDITKGPWFASAAGLFADTGFDVRHEKRSLVVIARQPVPYPRREATDVVYVDSEWAISFFERGDVIIQLMANKLGEELHGWRDSFGGGSSLHAKPGGKPYNERTAELMKKHPDLHFWIK